jgi:protein-S-isoprenylcysteine O-methyltransferase Ste14
MVLCVKTSIGIGMQLALFATLIFLPVGTFDWPMGKIWLQVFACAATVSSAYLLLARPAALEARMRARPTAQAPADRLAFSLMVAALALPIIFASKDVFDWQIFGIADPQVQALGMAVFLLGFVITFLSMLHNEYAAPTIHIQKDAGHRLADTGLYSMLRHPMYLGFILFTAGTCLFLGSYAATAFALLALTASAIYRIQIEETTLARDLPGYADYISRVKWRLLPFIY